MDVFILIGASGSGKTTWHKRNLPRATVVSADDYFMHDDEYQFDPSKLPQAHGKALTAFLAATDNRDTAVVVDNTNTTIAEIAPYIAVAQARDYRVTCIYFANQYGNTHGVPPRVVGDQAGRIARMRQDWPGYWPHVYRIDASAPPSMYALDLREIVARARHKED